jgi:adenylate cyclase
MILSDEVEVHAKGMKEPLRCRQLLGHEDHPELGLGEEMACTVLAEPIPVPYVLLSGKHFDEQMRLGAVVALSRRRAAIEARSPLPAFSNILLRFEAVAGENEVPELYAKVLRPCDEPGRRHLIPFTSVPPSAGARLSRLLDQSP